MAVEPTAAAQDPISVVSTADLARRQVVPEGAPDAERFFNRELSWMAFNQRVLELAEDADVPLLERVRFCVIHANNLDEFFMVRVAGLHDQVDAGVHAPLLDGRTPSQTIDAVRAMALAQGERIARCLRDDLLPALAHHDVRILRWDEADEDQRERLRERFARQIFPVLTPLAVGLGRPFPYISNLSLSLAVWVRDPLAGTRTFARVKVPTEMLPRLVEAGEGPAFVPLEEVIAANLEALFPGMEIAGHGLFRVTRDADFEVSDEADDLLQAVEAELRRRRFGEVVRVEVQAGMDPGLRAELGHALGVEERQVYDVDGFVDPSGLTALADLPGLGELRYAPWTPVTQPRLQGDVDLLEVIRAGDVLVHHPYDSFSTSVERFVEQAVADPDVLAIKLTIYRTSDDTPLIPALVHATERGKQAVCVVELKARFDERANIFWARALEEAGVHVVYGHPALKTHAKTILVVRREGDGVRHYVHIGTGNYHPKTARLYTDFGLFTCDDAIGADVGDMFNFLTGLARPQGFRRLVLAPLGLRERVIEEIDRTIAAHREGRKARIALKMNALVDRRCIGALYRASRAGVPVDLNVRGICCLRPGVEGLSEHIRVVSVVGRFLEHSRVFAFVRGDERSVWIGSADLMPRNLDTRIEAVAPVLDGAARDDLLDALERCLADDVDAWELQAEGSWRRRATDPDRPRSVHRELMQRHAARAAEAHEG